MTRSNLLASDGIYEPERPTDREFLKFCGKSLKIRQISAGGCSACELDFNVLGTLAWDMGRFGIQVVASPRHADCILVTGPVSRNMLLALKKGYDAAPRPVWVIACGACAISGGIYADSPETCGGIEEILKPDLYVPGCPPHPATLLEAMLRLMNNDQHSRARNPDLHRRNGGRCSSLRRNLSDRTDRGRSGFPVPHYFVLIGFY